MMRSLRHIRFLLVSYVDLEKPLSDLQCTKTYTLFSVIVWRHQIRSPWQQLMLNLLLDLYTTTVKWCRWRQDLIFISHSSCSCQWAVCQPVYSSLRLKTVSSMKKKKMMMMVAMMMMVLVVAMMALKLMVLDLSWWTWTLLPYQEHVRILPVLMHPQRCDSVVILYCICVCVAWYLSMPIHPLWPDDSSILIRSPSPASFQLEHKAIFLKMPFSRQKWLENVLWRCKKCWHLKLLSRPWLGGGAHIVHHTPF